MKKVLLSLSMLAAVMSANAQAIGVGAYDDFNSTTEYGTETSGIYWFGDAVWTQFYPGFGATSGTPATPTRRTGTQMVFTVDKAANYTVNPPTTVDDNAKYSPFGVSFGDNGAATPVDNTIDISANKSLSIDLKAYKDVTIRVQLKDIDNNSIEATAGTTNSWAFAVGTTIKTFTLDVSNGVSFTWGTGCSPCEVKTFQYNKVSKILFFVDPGHAGTTAQAGSEASNEDGIAGFQPSTFSGAVTIDNFKVGTTVKVGLGTSSAASKISSSTVFPNPTEGEFNVRLNLNGASEATILVSDLMGKQVASKTAVNGVDTKFYTTGLAKGMYTVTYVIDGTPAKSELVVVK